MEDTIIKLETAVFAKEKGFGKWEGNIKDTWYCIAKYFHKKPSGYGLVNWQESDVLCISGYDGWINEYPICDIFTYAPTQSILQKWLREKHQIFVTVLPFRSNEDGVELCWYYSLVQDSEELYDILCNEVDLGCSDNFESYDEALEEVLLEALKLI